MSVTASQQPTFQEGGTLREWTPSTGAHSFFLPMTKQELQKTHPDYDEYLPEWLFYIRSYLGGKAYRDGDYLKQHPFESDDNYDRRKTVAYFYNYCSPIVDIFTSYVTKKSPKRSYGDLSSDVVPPRKPKTLFDAFWWDVDLEGTNFEQFMREVGRYAAIYGRVSVIVDKPAIAVKTQAQAVEQGVRPYLNIYTPENVLDWEYVRLPTGRPVLSMVKVRESQTEYKIWTRFGWSLWEIVDGEKNAVMVQAEFHALGEIPIVNIYNKKKYTGKRMIGVSDLSDIAEINKNIYSTCSDAGEIIENTAFPMLALPEQRGATTDDEAQVVGPKNIQEFDPDAPNGKPFWLEAPHSSLAEIREWIEQDAQEMVRIAKMGGIRNIEKSKQPWSGIAIEGTENQLYAALVEKATNSEQGELDILHLYAKWEDEDFTGNVEYSKEFAIRDLTVALQNASLAGKEGVKSLTFEKERQKKIVDSTLTDIEEVTREKIDKEIEEMTELPTPIVTNPDTGGGINDTGDEEIEDGSI